MGQARASRDEQGGEATHAERPPARHASQSPGHEAGGCRVGAKAVTLGELRARRSDVIAVAGRRGASRLRVFGSVARQAADDASDLDLLVDLEPGRTLLDLVALELDLAALLGCRVDIGTRLRPSVHPGFELAVAEL